MTEISTVLEARGSILRWMDGRNWGRRYTTHLKHRKRMRVYTLGERNQIKTHRKMETITTIYCEFKNLIKYQYVVCIKCLWAWMQMTCQKAERLSRANLCQQIRWPWWRSLYFSRKLSRDKLLEDDIANLNWAMTLTVWEFHHRTLFKSQAQRGSQL